LRKKIAKIFAFITGLLIIAIMFIVSYSKWFNEATLFIPSPYRYGDLYYFSNMPGFRSKTIDHKKNKFVNPVSNIRLTIIGDSYMNGITKENFKTQEYDALDWGYIPDTIPQIDTSKTNILILETTERYARWRLRRRYLIYLGNKNNSVPKHEIKLNAEDNLQYLLTNFDMMNRVKEIKSYMYLALFNRFDSRIAKPNGAERLYLNETIDENLITSSYSHIDDAEIDEIVKNLTLVKGDALYQGYDEVYFSIIPNAASIYNYNQKKYNHLIERIHNHDSLKMKFINAYQLLSESKNNVFHYSDSHWNTLGSQLWLDEVNNTISSSE